jgi:hypothetical protein
VRLSLFETRTRCLVSSRMHGLDPSNPWRKCRGGAGARTSFKTEARGITKRRKKRVMLGTNRPALLHMHCLDSIMLVATSLLGARCVIDECSRPALTWKEAATWLCSTNEEHPGRGGEISVVWWKQASHTCCAWKHQVLLVEAYPWAWGIYNSIRSSEHVSLQSVISYTKTRSLCTLLHKVS